MILPLRIGELSSACAPGSTLATSAIMSLVLCPKTATDAAPMSATPATINAYSTNAAPFLSFNSRRVILSMTILLMTTVASQLLRAAQRG
jgi:hypothetical protein